MKAHLLFILLFGCVLLFSCEKSLDTPPLTSEEIGLAVNLENIDGTKPYYVYGPVIINFSVSSKKGTVESIQFFYQGNEMGTFTARSGSFLLTPEMNNENETKLELIITIVQDKQKYHENFNYKIQYVKITEKDFELKDATIDRFAFKMTGKKLENYDCVLKYMLKTKIIEDWDNIIVERKFAQFSFPTESSVFISLLPKGHNGVNTSFYPSVELNIQDNKLGDFRYGSSLFQYIDVAHEELYVWSAEELTVFDKNMNEIMNQPMDNISFINVTPKSGLVVVKPLYDNIKTYSDKSLSTVLSSIEPRMRTGILKTNEKDQLFNGHNSMIDVYDLHTGELVYTIDFHTSVYGYAITGDKLLVRLGNDNENHVYQLNENSAMFLYSFEKAYFNPIAHPLNPNHIILDNSYNGFEIYDVATQTSVFTCKGQFQSIDPIKGYLLYFDENYGVNNVLYDNHVIDLNYNEIFVFEDASRSSYGAFLPFNNHLIKGHNYTNLFPQNNK